ncbi:hypothetical protein [Kitasatospora sp. NPDC018614]|uniref:hypothetical protein n=1 Tax=Kitasatospora sp. NPDC018614 TaxID=3364026 RepID=UPI00378D6B3A
MTSTDVVPADTHPTPSDRPLVIIRDEMAEVLRAVKTQTRPVRVHGGRLDHTAREERPGRWRTACGGHVHPEDFERALSGTPCRACRRALGLAADPAAAALRAHTATVQRRETAGQPPLPDSEPRLDPASAANPRTDEEQPAS